MSSVFPRCLRENNWQAKTHGHHAKKTAVTLRYCKCHRKPGSQSAFFPKLSKAREQWQDCQERPVRMLGSSSQFWQSKLKWKLYCDWGNKKKKTLEALLALATYPTKDMCLATKLGTFNTQYTPFYQIPSQWAKLQIQTLVQREWNHPKTLFCQRTKLHEFNLMVLVSLLSDSIGQIASTQNSVGEHYCNDSFFVFSLVY